MATYDLTDEEKAALIEQRLKQFGAEKFQHELNRETATAIGNTDAVIASDQAISDLDTAIAVHEQALAGLPVVVVDDAASA